MSDQLPAISSDVHYEIALDDEPDAAAPVPVGETLAPARPDRMDLVPKWLQPAEVSAGGKVLAYRAACHTLRIPEYLALTLLWGVVGVFKTTGQLLHWWHLLEQHDLRSRMTANGDRVGYMSLHKDGKETRKTRGLILAICLGPVALAALIAGVKGYGWADLAALGVAWPWLAHRGHPADKPILRPVVVSQRFRLLNADVVLRAMYAAGLGSADKPDQQVTFGSTMQRDGEGSRVLVDLPYGKSLKDAVQVKDAIASGLDVTESQVYLHRDPTSARRFMLWVADRDPLAVPVGRTPLLACRQTDIWKAAPLGLDERGQPVGVPLMWHSLLVGALPRMGKTWAARQLALHAALDPYVKLHVFDPTGKPDWRKFAAVADSCAFGLTPTLAGLPAEILLQTLNSLKDEVQQRYQRLSELQATHAHLVPEGKLTRALARDLRANMQVNVLVIDEIQEYLDLGAISLQIADLIVFITKVAPAAGMPVIIATQRPSGIGTGTTGQRFTTLRDMCALRFSLRTPEWRVSEMVLGAGALGEGLDSSKLLPEYKGVGILRGASDKSPTTRTFTANDEDAAKILTAARALRDRAGTLSGMALGEAGPQPVSVVADVLAVMGEQSGMHWEQVARGLAQRFPERHADVTAESVSAQCRAAGVASVDVRWPSGRDGTVRKGCRKSDLEAATRNTAGQHG